MTKKESRRRVRGDGLPIVHQGSQSVTKTLGEFLGALGDPSP
jgi:hypothetical protein